MRGGKALAWDVEAAFIWVPFYSLYLQCQG